MIRVPKPASQLTRAYQSYQSKYPRLNSPPPPAPLIAPRPQLYDERHQKRSKVGLFPFETLDSIYADTLLL